MADTFRVMTYNVHSARGGLAARAIRACAPDVVCVQEAPRFLRWRSLRARLAEESGLVVVTDDHGSGVAVLGSLRTQVVEQATVRLSWVRGLHHRALAVAVLDLACGGRITAASMHLDLATAARRIHIGEVFAHLDRVATRHGAPVVLAGDVNEEPGGPTWERLDGRLRDAFASSPRGDGGTFPARRPRSRIDAIFVDPAIAVGCCGVPRVEGLRWPDVSDHRPVIAELTLQAEEALGRAGRGTGRRR